MNHSHVRPFNWERKNELEDDDCQIETWTLDKFDKPYLLKIEDLQTKIVLKQSDKDGKVFFLI